MRTQAQDQMDFLRPEPIRPVVIKPKRQPEEFFFIGLAVTMFRKHLFYFLALRGQKL